MNLVTEGDVWAVVLSIDYDSGQLVGVFGSLALAKDACNVHSGGPLSWHRHPNNYYRADDGVGCHYHVTRVTINEVLNA